jgi:poly-gamma-glutamate capsule biosynthesis protein CapA/YwtB (metallophosphatase superfamily)
MSANRNFCLIVTGDAILNRTLIWVKDPEFDKVRALIASGDASFTNLETVPAQLPMTPMAVYQGHNASCPPETVDELLKMGFNLYSFANNHSADFGGKGIRDTLELFRGTGATIAGAGDTLEQARLPRYLETANGRVALIAATVSNAWLAAAADAGPFDIGRPGVNPLRTHREYILDEASFNAQEQILRSLGIPGATAMPYDKPAMLPFLDRALHFATRPEGSLLLESALMKKGDKSEVREFIVTEDGESICRWVREARQQADIVVVSIHCHESANGGWDTGDTPQFLIDAAHQFIDAGADVIAGHGPHRLRPIEIYKGKPIFYSLGSFSFCYDTIDRYGTEIYDFFGLPRQSVPSDFTNMRKTNFTGTSNLSVDAAGRQDLDRLFESVVVDCDFSNGIVRTIKLHPIVMGARKPKLERGYPALASVPEGTLILQELADSSEYLGTRIRIEETSGHVVGVIELG